MRKIILTTILALGALTAVAQGFPQPQLPERGWRNIDYVGDGIEGHLLDIYLPDSVVSEVKWHVDGEQCCGKCQSQKQKYKPIVVIYGSAWFANNAKDMATASVGQPLLDAGFAVVSVNHRGSPEAKYPAQINDIKAAIRYIRANADKYDLDTTFIGITGFSSGGHLSSLAGATNGMRTRTVGDVTIDLEGNLGDYTDYSSDVDAVVDWFGPVDMAHMENCTEPKGADSPEAVVLGANPQTSPELVELLSPITYVGVNPNMPRYLVIHGNSDSVVPYCQSVNFSDKLRQAGILEDFITVENGEHGPVTFNDDTFRQMARFFTREAGGVATFKSCGNPIVRNKYTADPAPMVYDGRLYLYVGHDEYYEGQDEAGGGKEFNITGWLCYSTDDMVNWVDHGEVLRPEDYKWAKEAAWAAQVVEKDGKFYFYTTSIGDEAHNGYCVGVAVAPTPVGPFVDAKGEPLVIDGMTPNGQRGWWNDIDPTVLVDGDEAWLAWGNGTSFLAKLKPNMIEIDGDIQILDMPRYIEGPWLSKHDDTYYLTYASMGDFANGDRGEAIDYATAPSMNGPWTHRGQLTGSAEHGFTIHPGLINFNGQDYLFYHNATLTLDGIDGAIGRRSVCVCPLEYNADGTMTAKRKFMKPNEE